jgi:hypothetical protein
MDSIINRSSLIQMILLNLLFFIFNPFGKYPNLVIHVIVEIKAGVDSIARKHYKIFEKNT